MEVRESMMKSELIIGSDGVRTLEKSRVMILGCGGVGSSCVEALVRGGVGELVVVDNDIVQSSNINRQAIAFESTLGRRKVEVMRAMALDINPKASIITHDMFVLPDTLSELFAVRPDYVIDAIDTIATKLAIAQYAEEWGISLVSSMGAGNKYFPERFEFADIHETSVCPLCKVIRKEARARGIKHLRVLYSREKPMTVKADEGADRNERANLGTMSYMPPVMGQMLAGEVIRKLLGIER